MLQLRREFGPDVEQRSASEPGKKGAIDTTIVALGSAGAFSAAVQMFKAWVSRDRTRTLSISWNDGKELHAFSLTGDAFDNVDALAQAIRPILVAE